MSSTLTRQKIIDAAVQCFNREGIANIRLQHIADEAVVSVGNMTYHYRNKDAIVHAIWEQLVQKQRDLLAEFRILPLFEDIERLLVSTFALQQQYRFFYVDTLEVMRAFPDIQTAHRQHISWQVQQMEMAAQFNQSRGAFYAEKWEGQYAILAKQFWLLADLWMYRQNVQNDTTTEYESFRLMLWALFQPFFTDMGSREFEQLKTS
ncbi:MAG: TetR/AcrR family transcriptional regulator [Saprospiraceae bacterium]|nr:TetR/AcrR family transcriptional regulator [Saprospiraceae bacterium]